MIIGKLTTNKYIMDEERKKIKTCSSSLKKITTSEFKVYLYTIVYYYYFLNLFH